MNGSRIAHITHSAALLRWRFIDRSNILSPHDAWALISCPLGSGLGEGELQRTHVSWSFALTLPFPGGRGRRLGGHGTCGKNAIHVNLERLKALGERVPIRRDVGAEAVLVEHADAVDGDR